MQLWTINELMHLTRDELCRLALKTEHDIRGLEAGSIRRGDAVTTLENIRRVMTIRGYYF